MFAVEVGEVAEGLGGDGPVAGVRLGGGDDCEGKLGKGGGGVGECVIEEGGGGEGKQGAVGEGHAVAEYFEREP